MNYYALTDIGLMRKLNQDAYYCGTNEDGDSLFLVCDGIGGGNAGEVASEYTCKYFEENFPKSSGLDHIDLIDYFKKECANANSYVYKASTTSFKYYGMGTTLTGIFVGKHKVITINVGDSRVYGIKDGTIYQLTTDDTLVNEMVRKGQITYEESINHPKRHYLVKAIGIYNFVDPTVNEIVNMDYFLVCSDGLTGMLSDEEIKEIICEKDDSVEVKAKALLSKALSKGGFDNITLILVEK